MADLVKELQAWGVTVVVSDPWADADEVKHEYGIELSEISALQPVDSIIVAVGHNEFRHLKANELKTYCTNKHKPVLGDLKSLFDRHELDAQGFSVFRF